MAEKMKKAFTLIELVVAVAILAMIISSAGVIFKVSINTQRAALANAEILQKFRTVVNQLNSDFRDIRKDAPFFIWFDYHQVDLDDDGTADTRTRFDEIMFFTAGDFHSTQMYDFDLAGPAIPRPEPLDGRVVRGNTARIFYGQGQVYSPSATSDPPFLYPWRQTELDSSDETTNRTSRILARRRHIFVADNPDEPLYLWPDPKGDLTDFDAIAPSYIGENTNIPYNDFLEHDSLSIAKWRTVQADEYRDENILTTCFDFRPLFDREDPNTYHNLLVENVAEFQIQWAYWNDYWKESPFIDEREIRWFPSDDPDGIAGTPDSHFLHQSYIDNETGGSEGSYAFGTVFNLQDPDNDIFTVRYPDELLPFYQWDRHYWLPIDKTEYTHTPVNKAFEADFFPKALKFTFRIYDSDGVIEDGRTFTHIIYLDD